MHSSDSGLTNGTSESPQTTTEQMEYSQIVSENEKEIQEHHEYLTKELPKGSPIKIPSNSNINEQEKQGYKQVKYTWQRGEYKYVSRWHTRTPGAPIDQTDTWVVERIKPGIGHGPNPRPRQHEILVGKTPSGKNKWVPKSVWDAAVRARKNGTETNEQKEMLDNGHWKDKR
ncbi:hypothetical protein [Eubacterium ruminantium]|uniref:hypothetical protein n=1 Tax=Eubacterium ruminantium TaxID=42322 RepID=UPI0023F39B8E|nr:hypothetical protein [Eubacterium ruminantium]